MPHIDECTNDTLGFTVGLRAINASEFLSDSVLLTSVNESMAAGAFKFGPVIGISAVDVIGALGDDSADEKASGAVLGFIWKNIGIQFSGEIVDGYKRWILEVYRTIIETLQGIAWLLLVFFAIALIAYVIVRISELKRSKNTD